jgi:hypothetical protein
MPTFKMLQNTSSLKEIITSAFNTDLDISGSWGYTQVSATIIHSSTTPLVQLEHMFASMRAYMEMYMAQDNEERYGSINVNETQREEVKLDTLTYDKITYKITAMKETIYADFIHEYKENYGKKDFDLNKHFKARNEATITREVIHWFETTQTF